MSVTVATRSTYNELDPLLPQQLGTQFGRGAVQATTFSATETLFDCSKGSAFSTTLTASGSVMSAPNPLPGQVIDIYLKQDGTGNRTVTWNSVLWPGGAAPTLTTTAGATDRITLTWNDALSKWIGASSLNIS